MVAVQLKEFQLAFFKPTPRNAYATKPVEKLNRKGREDGQTTIVDVPQADGNSSATPADAVKPAEKPAAAD